MVTILLLQLTIAFPPGRSLPPLTLATAVAEADTLWSAYGVSIAAADDCSAPAVTPIIRVTLIASLPQVARRRFPARGRDAYERRPLGAIAFDADGEPSPFVSIFLGDILRLIAGARILGVREPDWPPILREQIVGRVVGRVLAHEIGHYLLRTRGHSGGLMRPNHLAAMLVSPERRPFELAMADAAMVARLADATEAGR